MIVGHTLNQDLKSIEGELFGFLFKAPYHIIKVRILPAEDNNTD